MRKYAWYSPELNVIVIQSMFPDCHVAFEWGSSDMIEAERTFDFDNLDESDLMQITFWQPLGEL